MRVAAPQTPVNTDSYSGWNRYDRETVANTHGSVHHGASSVQNLRAVGEGFAHLLLPDRIFTAPLALKAEGFWQIVGAVLFGALADAVELAVLPFLILWDLGQVIAHSIMKLANHLRGIEDGEVDSGTINQFDPVGSNLGAQTKRDPIAPPPLASTVALNALSPPRR